MPPLPIVCHHWQPVPVVDLITRMGLPFLSNYSFVFEVNVGMPEHQSDYFGFAVRPVALDYDGAKVGSD